MDTTGAVLGPLIGVFFLRHTSGDPTHKFRMLFLCAGIFGAIAVLLVLFAVREPAPEKPTSSATLPEKRAHPLPRWSALHPTYRRFLLIALLFNLGNSSDAFLILRAKSVGFSPEDLLWLYAAFNLVEAAFGYAAGRLSDQVGRRPLIIAGFGVFAFVYFGFALASSRTAIWFLFLLYGGYYTLTQGVQRAFAADLADAQQRAGQIGAYHAVVGFALLPASLIAGFLYSRHAALPFFVGASTATLSALLLLTLREKR
jgi:MFS family permease